MQMQVEDIGNGATKASLNGRLDIAGAASIDLAFNVLVGRNRAIVVDLSGVTFLASMGLRTLIVGAKTVASKGGRIVLLAPSADVEKVLEDSGVTTLLAIHHDQAAAIAAVTGR